jgi:hypothetical protein
MGMGDGGWGDGIASRRNNSGGQQSAAEQLSHSPSSNRTLLATRLDGAGLAKLETLEQAVTQVQRLNTIVERMAQSQRMNQPLAHYRQQIHRAAAPVASLLKAQFGPISDMVTTLVLISTRGGSDQQKVRSMREAVAQIRAQLEAADGRVRKQHIVESDDADPAS